VHERTVALRQLMARHGLSARDVARLLGCSETTVRIWRCKHEGRVIPANTLRLLELEVERAA
jgi:transcriptional regulator with XRE-family HTH domain